MAEAEIKTKSETMVAVAMLLEPYEPLERERILEAVECLLLAVATGKTATP